mgnify:CR=1 FL=1|jgi:hypothetical protein
MPKMLTIITSYILRNSVRFTYLTDLESQVLHVVVATLPMHNSHNGFSGQARNQCTSMIRRNTWSNETLCLFEL